MLRYRLEASVRAEVDPFTPNGMGNSHRLGRGTRAGDSQALHARFERGGFETEQLGGTARPADAPAGLLQCLGDLLKQKFGDKLTSMTQQDSASSSDAETDR